MSTRPQRIQIICDINIAVAAGARLKPACACIGLSARTVQRWQCESSAVDLRPISPRKPPVHALSAAEKAQIVAICNQPEYANLPPSQIVPKLADQGIYMASESTFNRVLRASNQMSHRGRAAATSVAKPPTTHIATAINQVWMWDITYLPSVVRGQFFYLYCVQDLYSRKIVAWEIHAVESGELAAQLMAQAKLREGFKAGLVLHSDNGAAMKSQTLWVKMQELGMARSYSRPSVSNDNPHIESFFRTLKYTPKWPSAGFKDLTEARDWTLCFIRWYNSEHQHSSLNFVTPEQRHLGLDAAILAQRDVVYGAAKMHNPARWSGNTRNWKPAGAMSLNPCKKEELVRQSVPEAA
jgi:putative transposase